FIFFFQAEDGIRDFHVTGVQTCALPISLAFFTLTNCSLDNNNNNDEDQIVRVLWHLENVSGGPSDVDNNFSPNVVVWEFNEINRSEERRVGKECRSGVRPCHDMNKEDTK